MFSKELALKIKEIVEKEKALLWKSEIYYLQGEELVIFLYSSREVKEEHEKYMDEQGWTIVEYKSKEGLYSNFYDGEKVYVWTGCYGRKI